MIATLSELEGTYKHGRIHCFPKSEYWRFQISWKHCQENFQFSRRDFFGLQDFDISIILTMYLTSCQDSRRGFGRPDFEISLSLVEILGEFLAAEIFRSRWDLGENLNEILRSRRESRRVFGCRDFEISLSSRWDLTEISAISPAKNSPRFSPRSRRDLAEISVKILQGKWQGKRLWSRQKHFWSVNPLMSYSDL